MARSGGWRQRIAAAEAESSTLASASHAGAPSSERKPGASDKLVDLQQSSLGAELLLEWGWGCLSAPLVQRLAREAVLDGADTSLLKKLAKLGSFGQHPQNIERELLNHFAANIHPNRLRQPLL